MALDLTRPMQAAPAATAQKPTGLAAVIRSKIATTLTGKKGDQFVADVVALVNNNPALGACDQVSLIASCLQAQTLGLSLNRAMGQAWIVPFKDKKNNRTTATFQIGYKGFVQLAIRSGQYRRLNVVAIKESELIRWDPLLEEIEIDMIRDEALRANTPTCGYFAMFEYTNGFRKAMYWSREKMQAHARQYSQGYAYDLNYDKSTSFWSKNFDEMAAKTMLRQLISKWGVMSVEMLSALEADGRQSDGSYADGPVMDADFMASPAPQGADEETGEVVDVPVEAPVETPKPKRRKYECPQLNGKMVPESECNACAYREGCLAHEPAAE